jgi:zinc protease
MIRNIAKFLLCLVFTTLFVHAQQINLNEKIPWDPKVKIGKLDNGLTYYIRENHKPQNRLYIRLVVNAGSILEDDDQQGLAHFVEHMAFNGTKHFAKDEIISFMESIGMRFGPEINAYTSFDETVYMLELPTDTAGVVEKGIQILRDWAKNISFDDTEIDKERGVIIEEWRQGRGASARMQEKHFPVIFENSKYAERIPIGKVEILKSFNHDVLRRFYKDWYRPDLMSVVAVGDVKPGELEKLIKQNFADIQNPDYERPRKVFDVPDDNETRISIASDKEATYNVIQTMYLKEKETQLTVGDIRENILNRFFNMMLNERFNEITKQANPPFLNAYSNNGNIVRTKDAYSLTAVVREGEVDKGLKAVLTEAERIKKYGFTQPELDRAKLSYARSVQKQYEERDKLESSRFAGTYTSIFLNGGVSAGVEYFYKVFNELLDGISVDQVNSLIDTNIRNKDRVITLSLAQNDNTVLPTKEEITEIFNDASKENVKSYEENVSNEPLIKNLPAPGKIVHENYIKEIDVTELTLSNGVKVVLKPTNFKNDEILFTASSPGGNSLVSDSEYYSSVAATSIANESGVGDFSNVELRKKLAGKIVSVYPWIGELREGFEGTSSPTDIETLFKLVYLFFESPRFEKQSYDSFISRVKGYLENRGASPDAAFQDTIMVTMANYNFRSKPWSEDLLNKIDLQQSEEVYHDRFSNADDFTFYFVGNLDLNKMKKWCEMYLANLPSTKRVETWKDRNVRYPKGKIEKVVKRGIEPKSRVMMNFTGDYKWSPEESFYLNSVADYLDIKLREVIREDKSGTYGVGVWCSANRWPVEDYEYSITFGCDPDRRDELTNEILKQIDTLKNVTPEMSYINKIKEQDLRKRETDLEKNNFWLGALHSFYVNGRDPKEILNYPKLVETLTPEIIQSMAKKYLNENNYVRVELIPEQKNN